MQIAKQWILYTILILHVIIIERSFIMWNWLILFLLLFISLFYFSNIIIKIVIGFILFVLAIAIICLIIDFHNDPNKN